MGHPYYDDTTQILTHAENLAGCSYVDVVHGAISLWFDNGLGMYAMSTACAGFTTYHVEIFGVDAWDVADEDLAERRMWMDRSLHDVTYLMEKASATWTPFLQD